MRVRVADVLLHDADMRSSAPHAHGCLRRTHASDERELPHDEESPRNLASFQVFRDFSQIPESFFLLLATQG